MRGTNLLAYNLGLYSNASGNLYPFTAPCTNNPNTAVPGIYCTIPSVAAVDVNGNFSVWDCDLRTAVRSQPFPVDVQHFGDLSFTSAAVGYSGTGGSAACVMGAADATGCGAGSNVLLTSSTIIFPPIAYVTPFYWNGRLSIYNPATGTATSAVDCVRIPGGDDRSAWCTLPTLLNDTDRDRWLPITFRMTTASVNVSSAVYVTSLPATLTGVTGCLVSTLYRPTGSSTTITVASGCYTGMPLSIAGSNYLPNNSLAFVSTVQPGRTYLIPKSKDYYFQASNWRGVMPALDAADVGQPLLLQVTSPSGLASALFPPASNQPVPFAVVGGGDFTMAITAVTGYNCTVSPAYNAATSCMGQGLLISMSSALPPSWTAGTVLPLNTIVVNGIYTPCPTLRTLSIAGANALLPVVVFNSTTLLAVVLPPPVWPQDIYRGKWLDVSLTMGTMQSNTVPAAWIWPTTSGTLNAACSASSSSSSSSSSSAFSPSSSSSTAPISLTRQSSSSSSSPTSSTTATTASFPLSSSSLSSSSSSRTILTSSSYSSTGAPGAGGSPFSSSAAGLNIPLIVGVVVGVVVVSVLLLVLLVCCGCMSCCCVGWAWCAALAAGRGKGGKGGQLVHSDGVVLASDASNHQAADLELSVVANGEDGQTWEPKSTSD